MICAGCDDEIPGGGLVCPRCNDATRDEPGLASHRTLAGEVRRIKGLVILSVMFGLFVAPFAVYGATRALHEHRDAVTSDPSTRRQLVLLRRIAIGLLLFWAFFVGTRAAWFLRGT